MEGLDKREADAAAGSSDDVRDHDSSEQEKMLRQQVVSTSPSEGFQKFENIYTPCFPRTSSPAGSPSRSHCGARFDPIDHSKLRGVLQDKRTHTEEVSKRVREFAYQ